MKSQVLNQYDDKFTADQWVNLEDVDDPKIEKATDVIVRIGGAGVCRTGRLGSGHVKRLTLRNKRPKSRPI